MESSDLLFSCGWLDLSLLLELCVKTLEKRVGVCRLHLGEGKAVAPLYLCEPLRVI